MGLDGVELVFAVEDAFRIHVADEEASCVRTVGDLHDLVIRKISGQESQRCLTSAAFYLTRRGIVDVLRMKRSEVRPSTPLEVILPRRGRRKMWAALEKASGIRLPKLVHSSWIQNGLLLIGVALGASVAIYEGMRIAGIVGLAFLGIVLGAYLVRFSPFLAFAFPNHDLTVGDLARDVVRMNHSRLANDMGGWNKQDVWETLCRVIIDQTGLAREKIKPEASIVDDLGID